MVHARTEDVMGMKISVEEMERTRVARFNRLTPTSRGFVDTAIPGYERLIYNVIGRGVRSEEHTSELQSRPHLVCRLLLVKKKIEDTLPIVSSGVPLLTSTPTARGQHAW